MSSEKVRDLSGNPEALQRAFKKVFDTDEGRSVLMHWFREFGMNASIAVYDKEGKVDPLATMMKEGKRTVVMGVFNAINADISPYIQTLQKNNQ